MSRSPAVALLGAVATLSFGAAAQPELDACIEDHVRSQESRMQRRLLEAREALIRCSACPSALASECAGWLDEVNRAVPSVVVTARDPEGRDLASAQIQIDGRAVAPGAAVELDPGEHEIVASVGATQKRERFVASEGEKGRSVVLVIGTSRPVPPPLAPVVEPSRPIPTSAWVVGSIGLASLAGFGIFLGLGESVRADLDSAGCRPRCPQDDIDRGNTYYVVGDVFLGSFAIAAVTTVVLVLTRPEVPAASPGRSGAPWIVRF